MKKSLTLAAVFSLVLALSGADAAKRSDWHVYGKCEFSTDSVKISVPEEQKAAYSMIMTAKPLSVKPGEKIKIKFNAKGKGTLRVILYLTHSKRKSSYAGEQQSIKLSNDEFEQQEVELTVSDEKAFGAFPEKCSVGFMAVKKGSEITVKDIKIEKSE